MPSNVSLFTPFSGAQAKGLIVVPVFALLSALALAFIVFRSIRFVVIPSFRRNATICRAPENLFFRTQLGHYAASLVLSNVFLTAAGLMEFYWVRQSGIHQGFMCSSQAVLMQIGNWSTCFFSVAIGLHTCNSLVFRIYQINWLSVAVIAFGWIISLVIALAPLSEAGVYGPITVSCGVTMAHPGKIFGLEAFPVILGSVLSVILYALIFLDLRGILHVKGSTKITCKSQWCAVNDSKEYQRFIGAIAKYPIAFVFLLLPFTVANLTQVSGRTISFGADIFAHVCSFMLGLVNVGLLYNTFRVLSPVFHGLAVPKIQVDTEKTFGNDAFDESPILPPAAHMPKGPLLPLYNDDSKTISPVSLSDFPVVRQHSRNSSSASLDSTTQLLSTKRKPSRYHHMRVRQGESMLSLPRTILPAAELNRQLGAASEGSLMGRNLRLDLPMAEVHTAKTTLVTVSLSPAPRSAVASMLTASPITSAPVQSTNPPPIMRQFTAAFGSPRRKSVFGPRSKGSDKLTSALPIGQSLSPVAASPSGKSPTDKSVSRFRVPSITAAGRRRPSPLDLTDITPIVPAVRPLPAITTEVKASQKVDKGKRRALPPPVEKDATSRSRAVLRPLPQFPHNSVGSSSSSERSRLPDPVAPTVSYERHVSLSSLSSISSTSSSLSSPESAYSSNTFEEGSGKALPSLPPTRDNTIEGEDSIDSESSSSLSFGTRRQALQSGRATWTTVWSQESAVTTSQPPAIEAMSTYASLVLGASAVKGDQASVENVPKRQEVPPLRRVQIPPTLLPGNLAGKLSGLPPWLRT
ncbi:uncharacterized protein EDB91DRAFT_1245589 [Suillus paluster]|uniref:uncharacterized protein n=1 Tax=Suillus paluster TaxID=48578 RepID=UPI001B8752BA|nr:uncharacterized protein EDB91DRAFT_1245589 [Suillus paluster]KAG1747144.1 hypothetical protein EDB91DRAFT_1245589 [Suillus paluster]